MQVDDARVYPLNVAPPQPGRLVICWMSRDPRADDNWALLHAAARARELDGGLAAVFCLDAKYPAATARAFDFLRAGLRETEAALARSGIPFLLLRGAPTVEIPACVARCGAGEVICDFDPLLHKQAWRRTVAARLDVPVVEVDAHNIVPARWVSDRREVGARTLRPKITRALPRFLTPFPRLERQTRRAEQRVRTCLAAAGYAPGAPDAPAAAAAADEPGAAAAAARLRRFLASGLARYAEQANDPNADACSRLSPHLHFGQLAAQRVAWEVSRTPAGAGREAFLEQLVVRRELADNFCLYEPVYDRFEAAPVWARATLERHRNDRRAYRYDADDFEQARTHDDLWNAAQRHLVARGELHGYVRMYWAKKMLEWSEAPEAALETAIRLNDRYALDGRDPNGYTNIAWSVLGVHDRPWPERPVYGMVRSMMRSGCERKFDVAAAIRRFEGAAGERGA